MATLWAEQMFVLFLILAIGCWLGQLSLRGISLGTAGVLFVSLLFGHFGFKVPREVRDLGLLLFVYAVGLQAGPRFFRAFKRQGLPFVITGVVSVLAAAISTAVVARLWHIAPELATGLYTGAVTNTPALAAAIDMVERIASQKVGEVSVGYGVAYPFSMIGTVLLIQFLPRLLRRDLRNEEEIWKKQQELETVRLQAKQFVITNPNCEGKSILGINPHRMSLANISRIRRGDTVFPATPDFVLHCGDVVMAVGPEEELEKLRVLLGEETQVAMDINPNVVSADVDVTEGTLAGKKIGELRVWEQYGVVITRIRRQGAEITPVGSVTIELGDTLRIVGEQKFVESFAKIVGTGAHKDETNMVTFLVGLVVGIAVGSIPFHLSGGIQVKMGAAGGAFLVSLILGHFGRIGRLALYVPPAARNLSRELGLMLFLAGAGTTAGAELVRVLQQQGPSLFVVGAIITSCTVILTLLIALWLYRMSTLAAMGALAACMTNPPALGAASSQTDTDLPTLAYASVYPVALIFKILVAQVMLKALAWVVPP
ncbi:MAG: aspartate:alanine exchanger family transporter [Armatimonadota bacterium]